MAETAEYRLDLLTSFDARSGSGGFMSANDGLRRLQKMVSDGAIGIAVRVRLHIENGTVIVTDLATGDEMEHFPANLIHQPTAAVGDRSLAPYDNVVIFTVLEDSFQMAPPEMYCFQCIGCSAYDVVDTLQAIKAGRSQYRKSTATVSNVPATNRMQDINEQAQRSAMLTNSYRPGPPTGEMFRQSVNLNSSTSEKTSQYIKLLDRCLDEIEKFVSGLQQAAQAYAKLEQRRNERQGGSGQVGMGDGLLMMRARPPPTEDFVNVLQKFKLSINLLSSLKGHIHNPNAPEMVHYLFKPLDLIINAVRDPGSGAPTLAQKVVTPLLTAESVQLLSDCLTTRESQLWRSLGDAWTRSRDQWPTNVPAYVPIFSDGWSPPPYWLDDSGAALYETSDHGQQLHRTSLVASDAALSRVDRKPSTAVADNKIPDRRSATIYPISEVTGVTDDKQQKFVWELLAKQAKIFLLLETYAAGSPKELSVRKGEVIEVLDDSKKWWNVRNSLGQTGYIPSTILRPYSTNSPQPAVDPRSPYVNNDGRQPTPPPIARQEPVVMRASVSQAPVDRRSNSQYMSDPPIASPRTSVYSDPRNAYENPPVTVPRTRSVDDQRSSYAERLSVGAAPAFGYQEPPIAQRTSVIGNEQDFDFYDDVSGKPANIRYQRTAVDDLNDEFRRKLSGAEAMKPRQKAQQVAYISQESTNEDIINWLYLKGFSDNVLRQLAMSDGKQLFSLSKPKLEMMFGAEEGGRLYSQILVQRNLSGYKTARSSELQAILKRQKQLADSNGSATTESF